MIKLFVFVCLLVVTMAAPKPDVVYAAYAPAAYAPAAYAPAAYAPAAYTAAAYSAPIAYASPYTAASSSYYYTRPYSVLGR